MYRTITMQQKRLVDSAEYMKPDGMNWYLLHHWEHFRDISEMPLGCFHSHNNCALSIVIWMSNNNIVTVSCPQRQLLRHGHNWQRSLWQVILFNRKRAVVKNAPLWNCFSKFIRSKGRCECSPLGPRKEDLSTVQEDRDKRKKGKNSSGAFDPSNAISSVSACQPSAGTSCSSGEHVLICKTICFYLLPWDWVDTLPRSVVKKVLKVLPPQNRNFISSSQPH